jgi:hypothetical protein
MGPEDVRAIKRGTAILLASGARPAMLRLNPWFRQPGAPALELATAEAITQISDAAERERLIAGLAQDGVQLPDAPAPPVQRAPGSTPPAASQPHGTASRFPDVQMSDDDDEGGPGAARRTVKPSVPQFRGSTRQP